MEDKINVNMSGIQYLMYLDRQEKHKPKLSKQVKRALPYFILALIGTMFIVVLIDDLGKPAVPPKTALQSYYEGATIVAGHGWTPILQWLVLVFAPFLAGAIVIGWVIHGVGFYIVR